MTWWNIRKWDIRVLIRSRVHLFVSLTPQMETSPRWKSGLFLVRDLKCFRGPRVKTDNTVDSADKTSNAANEVVRGAVVSTQGEDKLTTAHVTQHFYIFFVIRVPSTAKSLQRGLVLSVPLRDRHRPNVWHSANSHPSSAERIYTWVQILSPMWRYLMFQSQ